MKYLYQRINANKRRKVYLTDRSDDGKLFGYLVAVDDEFVYDVELAPGLVVLSSDRKTRIPTLEDLGLAELRQLVDEQAEDEGLWFIAESATEAYLQQELRRLHAFVESAIPLPQMVAE